MHFDINTYRATYRMLASFVHVAFGNQSSRRLYSHVN